MPSTDIAALHTAIKDALTAAFPECHVGFYERHAEKLPKYPAIHFHLAEIEPNTPDTDGDSRLEIVLRFAAYVTVNYRKDSAKIAVRVLAANLMRVIRANRWGARVGPARLGTAAPDEWSPVESGFETYRIPWTHEAVLEPLTAEDPLAPIPSEILLGLAPATGPDHLAEYERLTPA